MSKFFQVYNTGKRLRVRLAGIKIFSLNVISLTKKKLKKSKVEKGKIVFINFTNKGYGCNPKYIADFLLETQYKYDLVWLINPDETTSGYPEGIRFVRYDTYDALKELATAQFWISNCRMISYLTRGLEKKANQIYIQTWHGFLGIKKVENDAKEQLSEDYVSYSKLDSSYIDFFISPSKFDSLIIRTSFWYAGDILECGYPRNDIFDEVRYSKSSILNKLYAELNLDTSYNVVLYAPTFRDSASLDVYDIDIDAVLSELEKKFNKKFCMLIRLHPNISKLGELFVEKHKNCIDVSRYADMQELLLLADVLITDYSSICFDFSLSNRPVFIFATDISSYCKERGFYIDINSLPYSISKSNAELLNNINLYDNSLYLSKLVKFKQKQGYFEHRKSSETIARLINKKVANFSVNSEYFNDKYQYLKRYLYSLTITNTIIPEKSTCENNNTIWQMWWQGIESVPPLVKTCLESVRKFYPNNVVLITQDNYKDYVNIPESILKKYKQGIISIQAFSDVVRTLLLADRGGIWIDATCLLTNKIPKDILESPVFYFKSVTWSLNNSVPSEEVLRLLTRIPTYLGAIHTGSSWFIVSKKGSYLFAMLKRMIVEYWENENSLIDYFLFHLLLTVLIVNNPIAKKMYEEMLTLSNRDPHLLLNLLKDEYSESLFEDIKCRSFIHKLSYKGIETAMKNENSFYNALLRKDDLK